MNNLETAALKSSIKAPQFFWNWVTEIGYFSRKGYSYLSFTFHQTFFDILLLRWPLYWLHFLETINAYVINNISENIVAKWFSNISFLEKKIRFSWKLQKMLIINDYTSELPQFLYFVINCVERFLQHVTFESSKISSFFALQMLRRRDENDIYVKIFILLRKKTPPIPLSTNAFPKNCFCKHRVKK